MNRIIRLGGAIALAAFGATTIAQDANTNISPGMQAFIKQLETEAQQHHQIKLDLIKNELGMADAEFAIIQPNIERVMDGQDTLTLVVGRHHSNGDLAAAQARNPTSVVIPPKSSPLLTASMDLQDTLSDPASTPELIDSKLQVYRMEKGKLDQILGRAQTEIIAVLSTRQEATLVSDGLLE